MNASKRREQCWDFRDAQTRTFTNCFHRYPAMMVPQVIDQLLRQFSCPGMSLLDPFCGTGRALIAGRLAGMDCFGIDINPLAAIVASSKVKELDAKYLSERLREILRHVSCRRGRPRVFRAVGLDTDYWFGDSAFRALSRLLESIKTVFKRECAAKDFFYVALSETIRDSSWTRKAEFKMYRMPQREMEQFDPDPISLFQSKVNRNIAGMLMYTSALPDSGSSALVLQGDARTFMADSRVKAYIPNDIDLVVTSPPYGDSRTTVDYGNFSRLSLGWLATDQGFAEKWGLSEEGTRRINQRCLGGQRTSDQSVIPNSSTLHSTVKAVARLDESRAQDVLLFFKDLRASLVNIEAILSQKGHACFIIANRTVKGIEIPMNEILIELARDCGLIHSTSICRRIFGKRLPARINTNSSTISETSTMMNEHIMTFASNKNRRRSAA